MSDMKPIFDSLMQSRLENVYLRCFQIHITTEQFMNEVKKLRTVENVDSFLLRHERNLRELDRAIEEGLLR